MESMDWKVELDEISKSIKDENLNHETRILLINILNQKTKDICKNLEEALHNKEEQIQKYEKALKGIAFSSESDYEKFTVISEETAQKVLKEYGIY